MKIELSCVGHDLSPKDIQEAAFLCVKNKVNVLSLQPGYLKYAKEYLIDVKLGAMIDYPFGNNPIEIKQHQIQQAIRNGADIVEVVINSKAIVEEDYTEFRRDIKSAIELCKSNKKSIRFILDHRYFDTKTILNTSSYLQSLNVECILTSCGYLPDDPEDNITISSAILEQTTIDVIPASNLWKPKHLSLLPKSKLGTVRIISLLLYKNLFGGV